MRKRAWIVGGVAGAGLLAALLWWRFMGHRGATQAQDVKAPLASETAEASGDSPKKGSDIQGTTPLVAEPGTTPTDPPQAQPPEFLDKDTDAAIATLDDFLDDENVAGILRESQRLIKHANPDVRQRVAFALSWIGMPGLPGLTAMLTDPDPEVAANALDYWTVALAEIENEVDKASLLGAAAEAFGENISNDILFDLVMECSMLDSDVALPQLAKMLQTVTKPEQKQEIIEAIHSELSEIEEDPSENEAELLGQVKRELALLAIQRAEEQADDADVDETLPKQGLPNK